MLEFGADFHQRFLPALARELAVAEEAARAGDAADLQAFAFDRIEAAADDAFGGAAADVHHQPALPGPGRLRMRDAEVDQARFFAAGHDFDGVAERGFRRHEEGLRPRQCANGIGGERAHALRRDVVDALAEAREAVERALLHLRREPAAFVEAFGEAHHLAQAIDDAQLAKHVARDHHVEAVGTEVDRGEQVAVLQRGLHRGVAGSARGVVHADSFASNAACAECAASPGPGERRR